VAAGFEYSCAVSIDGTTYCWGANGGGALGTGTLVAAARPSRVAGTARLVRVAAGVAHSCGVDVAGQGWCWGDNSRGQVDGSGSVLVGTPVGFGEERLRLVGAGEGWTCALSLSGSVTCRGARWDRGAGIAPAVDPLPWRPDAPLAGSFTDLSVGRRSACAVDAEGRMVCWGRLQQADAEP